MYCTYLLVCVIYNNNNNSNNNCICLQEKRKVIKTGKEGKKKNYGLVRDSNPGPLAPKARIIPLDQQATLNVS